MSTPTPHQPQPPSASQQNTGMAKKAKYDDDAPRYRHARPTSLLVVPDRVLEIMFSRMDLRGRALLARASKTTWRLAGLQPGGTPRPASCPVSLEPSADARDGFLGNDVPHCWAGLLELSLVRCRLLTDPTPISLLPKLCKLTVDGCDGLLHDQLPSLWRLPELRTLVIRRECGNSELGPSLEDVLAAPHLTALRLEHAQWVTDALWSTRNKPHWDRLEDLAVTGSQLSRLPEKVSFAKLTALDVRGNRSLCLWGALRTATALTHLVLSGCPVTPDDLRTHVAPLAQLQTLELGWCSRLEGSFLDPLRGLHRLQSLSLAQNTGLGNDTLAALADMRGLTALNLADCWALTDDGLAHLEHLVNLRALSLEGCRHVSDDGLGHLENMRQMERLSLSCCLETGDKGLLCLKNMPNLKTLDLYNCEKVTVDGLAVLDGKVYLEELTLPSSIFDAGLRHLRSATALKRLYLIECRHLTPEGLEPLRHFASLEELILPGFLTDTSLSYLHGMPLLRLLVVKFSPEVTNAGVANLRRAVGLHSLDLSGTKVGDDGLSALARLTQLETLHLARCSDLTDAGLGHLRQMHGLRSLDLNETKITDAGLSHVAELGWLKELTLRKCDITDTGIAHLARIHALRSLEVTGCSRITEPGLRKLANLPYLQRLIGVRTLVAHTALTVLFPRVSVW